MKNALLIFGVFGMKTEEGRKARVLCMPFGEDNEPLMRKGGTSDVTHPVLPLIFAVPRPEHISEGRV